jgi:hypothetical protein
MHVLTAVLPARFLLACQLMATHGLSSVSNPACETDANPVTHPL